MLRIKDGWVLSPKRDKYVIHLHQNSGNILEETTERMEDLEYRELCYEMISSELGLAVALKFTILMVTSA